MTTPFEKLEQRLIHQLELIYKDIPMDQSYGQLATQLISVMGISDNCPDPIPHQNHWDQKDVILITYGDSIEKKSTPPGAHTPQIVEPPLKTLSQFLHNYASPSISGVHILPFYPYSSDDGFSVIDYSQVNDALGDWSHINDIGNDFRLMADLVINHCSSRSRWFENFKKGKSPGQDYFMTASLNDDLTDVVRPRTSPLLKEVDTIDGQKFVWCTFSHDQVDFDFRNPQVLIEFAIIIKQYLDNGVNVFRLDAVAFLWKKIGTSCINLEQTHEIIRLYRNLIEHVAPTAVIITETNIPNRENLSYFGNANEAHSIYNFSLPPLLVYTLITGDLHPLKQWLMNMPPAQNGTTYFNFLASHDGIGLRPVEGLLEPQQINEMVNTMLNFGGRVSMRTHPDGSNHPYEMNIALFDALQGTVKGEDKYGLQRFICAHAVMFSLEGIPGLYIHSLLGTRNDYDKLKHTQHNRSINRHRWDYDALINELNNPYSEHNKVYEAITKLLDIRIKQPAFHPNATQFTLHLGEHFFGIWRQCQNRQQSIFCIYNISDQPQQLSLSDVNLISTDDWYELISGDTYHDHCEEIEVAPYQALWITNVLLD